MLVKVGDLFLNTDQIAAAQFDVSETTDLKGNTFINHSAELHLAGTTDQFIELGGEEAHLLEAFLSTQALDLEQWYRQTPEAKKLLQPPPDQPTYPTSGFIRTELPTTSQEIDALAKRFREEFNQMASIRLKGHFLTNKGQKVVLEDWKYVVAWGEGWMGVTPTPSIEYTEGGTDEGNISHWVKPDGLGEVIITESFEPDEDEEE